ncbi:hypothetical protein SARC_11012 [Sphaeroforma arctica JP610]|uniref:Uncharacterized protein n=1 Tax=Sphaeroforma arctica JP610 TaxID=667725 RepID=A0A0L0FI73_9EUKA|nr:hypothetical protein SARC_11012 [Sphaeroforma arctica JP610]KNC76487.1 hypothetical protein SARC_11012 [Sphaeroforma arctica JP610]|eukprot:XP_014150389.1 hypothetical protein SARC_11012 [Sphaeroforma arctica JP610]
MADQEISQVLRQQQEVITALQNQLGVQGNQLELLAQDPTTTALRTQMNALQAFANTGYLVPDYSHPTLLMNYRTAHPISNNRAFAPWFQTKVAPESPVSIGEPIELFSALFCQNVDFPGEQLSALQGVVYELVSDIIHSCEGKWICIKQGAAVATLVENKHRAAHGITGDYAETFRAVLQKKQKFDLIRGASHQNRQFDTRREHANKHGPPQNAPNAVQTDRSRGRERGSVGGRNGANKNNANKESSNPFKVSTNPFEK